jgi:hypothetical protein
MPSSGLGRLVVFTRATRRNITEDGILHSHGSENLKSYIDKALEIRKIPYPVRKLLNSLWKAVEEKRLPQKKAAERTIHELSPERIDADPDGC